MVVKQKGKDKCEQNMRMQFLDLLLSGSRGLPVFQSQDNNSCNPLYWECLGYNDDLKNWIQ